MDNQSIQQLSQFLASLEVQKHYSGHTLRAYRRDLNKIVALCGHQQITCWSDLQPAHLRQMLGLLHQQGLGGKSLQRLLSALRSLYRFLQKHQMAKQNPVIGIRAPQSRKTLPPVLDVDQMARVLQPRSDKPLEIRDLAILELAYSSGLRLQELVDLNLDSIHYQDGNLRVIGKGRKTRIVPVGGKALQALRNWLNSRPRFAAAGEPALFLSQRGNRISPRAIQYRLRARGVQTGLDKPLHPHLFRHSFATHLLESSGDLRAIQELLGHENISTTQIYTRVNFQYLAAVYDQAHPRAKKIGKPGP